MNSPKQPSFAKSRLHHLVDRMAYIMEDIDLGNTWTSLNCIEFDAIYDVLMEAGHTHIASLLLERHAVGDDVGDSHWLGADPPCDQIPVPTPPRAWRARRSPPPAPHS